MRHCNLKRTRKITETRLPLHLLCILSQCCLYKFIAESYIVNGREILSHGPSAVKEFVNMINLLPPHLENPLFFLSVCHTPVLYPNGYSYHQTFYSTRWSYHSGFLKPFIVAELQGEPSMGGGVKHIGVVKFVIFG